MVEVDLDAAEHRAKGLQAQPAPKAKQEMRVVTEWPVDKKGPMNTLTLSEIHFRKSFKSNEDINLRWQ